MRSSQLLAALMIANGGGGVEHTDNQRINRINKAVLYLFGLSCFGLEIEDIAQLRCFYSADDERHTLPRVKHPRYGFDIALTGLPLTLWRLYNNREDLARPEEGELLFPEGCAASFQFSVETLFAERGIRLYRSRSIFADLLGLIFSSSNPPVPASEILSQIIDGAIDERAGDWLRTYGRVNLDQDNILSPKWLILCIHKVGATPDKVEAAIGRLGEKLGQVQVYIPREEVVKKDKAGKLRRELKPVLGRYVFVQCSNNDAYSIERHLTSAFFIRKAEDTRRMAIVRDREILLIKTMYQDHAADVDLMEHDLWVKEQENYSIGQKVLIKTGPFAGYIGHVYRIKEGKAANAASGLPGSGKVFVVNIAEKIDVKLDLASFEASFAGLELEPIA